MRAKSKIRDAHIPYQVPERGELRERLDSVLRVIYLVFNEGYSASSGEALTRHDLSAEAIRLGRLMLELLPEPEVLGLLALMLLSESRRPARTTASGDLVLLQDQDRSLWNRDQIAEGVALAMRDGPAAGLAIVDAILARGELGDYRLAHAARADLCRRLGRSEEARAAYQRALELTRTEPERRFLERRLDELKK